MLGDITVADEIYVICGYTDMRKSIDGLALIVTDLLEMDPLGEAWFIFCNRQRDKLKILFWDTNGFWLYYRRLEKGRFKWPNQANASLSITRRQLDWLLSGLPLQVAQAHQPLEGLFVR